MASTQPSVADILPAAAPPIAPAPAPPQPPPAADKSDKSKTEKTEKSDKSNKDKDTKTTDGPAKKPTGAELKALKQAEKAKRRAAVIAAKEASGVPLGGGTASAGAQGKPGIKDAVSRPGAVESSSSSKMTGPLVRHPPGPNGGIATAAAAAASSANSALDPSLVAELDKDPRAGIPDMFAHLPMAKRVAVSHVSHAHKDAHPAVLAVGQRMAAFELTDNMARLEAMLLAFKKVIRAYKTPPGNAFSRHFVSHVLNPQIEYLIECRPMCCAMGNAIRLLKARVAQIDLDADDADATDDLCDVIDTFIQERIFVASLAIAQDAASLLLDGDVVLTFGGPRLVRAALERAWRDGVRLNLVVVDDPTDPTKAGQALAKRAQEAAGGDPDVCVTYTPTLDGLDSLVARATHVLLGVEAVFANGALLAPAGTSDVALAAHALGVPVIALSETVNFDGDRVATDALTYNEIHPDHCDASDLRLLYDTTPSSVVSMLICEYEEVSGKVPAHAIYQVMRTREEPN